VAAYRPTDSEIDVQQGENDERCITLRIAIDIDRSTPTELGMSSYCLKYHPR
jgi:hypothetical protein